MANQIVNNHALIRYQEFTGALAMVLESLEDADKLLRQMGDVTSRSWSGWRAPHRDELMTTRREAADALEKLRESAKTYEAELVSREWR